MAEEPAIRVQGLSKQYGLPFVRALGRWWRGRVRREEFPWALRNVNLEVRRGERLGVIGRNGAGKSTLLKVLAGVTLPTQGRAEVHGSLFPMIELNAGLHMELTGRENMRFLGALFGLPPGAVQSRIPDIESFSELGAWIERPARMYSSGMLARLGFAVAANIDAEILLIDEVLGVGDIGFYNKCLRRLEELHSQMRTILFVSHNMHHVRRICDRVLVLERGEPVFLGHPEEAIERYEDLLRTTAAQTPGADGSFDFAGVRLEEARLVNADGGPAVDLGPGEPVTLEFGLALTGDLDDVTLNIVIESIEAIPLVWESLECPKLEKGLHRFCVRWRELRLRAGTYSVRIGMGVGVFAAKGFRAARAVQFHMKGDTLERGYYVPECEFSRQFAGTNRP